MSEYKLDNAVHLYTSASSTVASLHLFTRTLTRKQIVHSSRRAAGLSRLETLPLHLLRKISFLFDDKIDLICLRLTSKTMAASARQLWARWSLCVSCGGYHAANHQDESMYDWYRLAMRVEKDIPETLQFCHHCLIFLPKALFAGSRPER